MGIDEDYVEFQRTCPHCKQGTTFIIQEICKKVRVNGPSHNPNNQAALLAIICGLCEKISLYTHEPLGSTFTFVALEEKKRKTTKRIA